ncbi:MAG: DNA polymerase III subunit gamma/tau [Bacteroidales bacterium]|nr:DNA polymerase III subunit gamma/tau [Bacteroidales bacterium]
MDKYIVSARKYRPASFGDVIGQSSITTTLKNSILNNHLGHAYLFSGPRGVGKTTCARIFAKTINCFNISDAGEACNQCESCQSFNENRSYNIHELDAASNNSVDDIRTLTEQVRIPPQIGSYSIYIIDEVHMLSQAAFNAFLKTLEEPPRHAVFVLATTEKHKIIPTILSRCQIFDFNRIRIEDAVEYMKQIALKESLDYEEDALHIIAQKADGAMRDALSIFDQVVSFAGEKITYQDVIKNLNILDYEYFFRLTSSMLENNTASALLLFNEVLVKGFDARNFINGYAAHLRDLMVCKNPETIQLMEVGAGIKEKYLSQSDQVSLPFLYAGLDICNQADIQFRSSRNQRLTIELALVKLANLSEVQKKKSVTEPVVPASSEQTLKAEPSAETLQPTIAEPSAKPEQPLESENAEHNNNGSRVVRKPSISIKETLQGVSAEPEKVEEVVASEGEVESLPAQEKEAVDPDRILNAWNDYATSIEKSNPRIFSTLKYNRPVIKADGTIMVLLNSEAQRDHFLQSIKSKMVGFIQNATGMDSVEIMTEVAEGEQNGKKIYTEQDKLDFLMNKNPELGHLKSLFNLDFDD